MLKGKLDPVPLRRMLYNYDSETIRNAALLLASEQIKLDLEPVLAMIAAWEKPVFPVQGEDVLKLGIKAGPQVGVILRAVEEWWLNQDFRPSRDECMAALQQHVTR
jgi:poly(A) polymerase